MKIADSPAGATAVPSVVAMVTETSPKVPKVLLTSNSTYLVFSSTTTLLALVGRWGGASHVATSLIEFGIWGYSYVVQ